jgi:hypothetical protein
MLSSSQRAQTQAALQRAKRVQSIIQRLVLAVFDLCAKQLSAARYDGLLRAGNTASQFSRISFKQGGPIEVPPVVDIRIENGRGAAHGCIDPARTLFARTLFETSRN